MKILFLTNNEISYGLFNWLKNEKHEDILLYSDEINLEKLDELKPNLIISYNYRFVIKKNVITHMKNKIINLHISLLPWNKGASPNLWGFLENTPKGVTIHQIDNGLDTGNIYLQKEVFFDEAKETLRSSYIKLHEEIQMLFRENWDKIRKNEILSEPQSGNGSFHFMRESEEIENIVDIWDMPILDLKEKYKELIDKDYD